MQAKLQEQLSRADAEVILGCLPERIRAELRVLRKSNIQSKQLLRWRSPVFWIQKRWVL